MAQQVENLPAVQETQKLQVWSLGQENPLEKERAAHSSILAWKTPRTEKPGVGYSPEGRTELDMTERLSTRTLGKWLLWRTQFFKHSALFWPFIGVLFWNMTHISALRRNYNTV